MKFADNRIPEFKEVKSKDYILFGEDNKFPDHLLYLYNKSSNHNAIINGKVTYILGNGFKIDGTNLEKVNRHGESFNKVFKKFCHDIEIYGGAYLEVIWNKSGQIADLLHMPFKALRKAKTDPGFFFAEDWTKYQKNERYIPPFDLNNRVGSQIFSYKEYRPGVEHYPLPGYFGALNDIETDVEISKYYLSVMKNGQFTGKIINFFNGEPTSEEKRELERMYKDKFNGSENAGKTMLTFNSANGKEPVVTDLSSTDLDKLFEQLNKNVQQEIFAGHLVTSPLLFGIAQPGALGNRSEMQDAYEIFKNTYVNEKQMALEEVANVFFSLYGVERLKIQPVNPIGFKLSEDKLTEIMPKEWIFEQLGVDITKYQPVSTEPSQVNENLKNMTGRQNQQLLRVIRQYEKGKLTREQATQILRTSLALSDDDINVLLQAEQFEKEYTEFEVAEMFAEIGSKRDEFNIVKSKPAKYEKELFSEIGQTDSNILDLIKKDKRITPEVIGKTLKLDPYYVADRIKKLTESGVLTSVQKTLGVDTIIEHSINREQIETIEKPETIDVYVKYSYEAKPGLKPVIDTTRPFCRRLIELDRLYTRAEIESISQRVGYSVWDRKGGFFGDSPECRHRWVSNIVVKKRK